MSSSKDDNARIAQLYEECYDALLHYCTRQQRPDDQLQSHAEDIVQETFMEAVQKWDRIVEHENLLGWLYRTAQLKIINMRRSILRRYRNLRAVSLDADNAPQVEDRNSRIDRIAEKEEAAKNLSEIYALLTDAEKTSITDHYDKGMSIPDMAKVSNTSEGAHKAALRRAREKSKKFREKTFLAFFHFLRCRFWTL